MRIEPTVGRSIHYYPASQHPDHGQVCAAIIAHVNADGTLNLAVFDCAGHHYSRKHVELIQDDAPLSISQEEAGNYARWMPYQVGQAQKTEQAERALADARGDDADLSVFKFRSLRGDQSVFAGVTAVANVGQLVNYVPTKGGFPVPARITNKHSDLMVDLVYLHGDATVYTSVPAVEHYQDGPSNVHYCTLCDPVDTALPVLGANAEVSRPATSSVNMIGDSPAVQDPCSGAPDYD